MNTQNNQTLFSVSSKKNNSLYISLFILVFILNAFPLFAHHLTIKLSHHYVKPGQSIKTYLLSKKKLSNAYITYKNKQIPLFLHPKAKKNGQHWYFAHLGISRKAKKEMTLLKYVSFDQKGKRSIVTRKLFIQKNSFDKEYIQLGPKEYKKRNNTRVLANENREITRIFNQKPSINKTFFSRFSWPLKGRLSSTFGKFRIYNGKPSWYHSGIDIAATTGSPIISPTTGIVRLVQQYPIHGNTIIIDHGFGVMSIFNHLNSILVKEGQRIKKEQIIGTVGKTGLATGPHLHWGLSVHNTRIDPILWLNRGFLYL